MIYNGKPLANIPNFSVKELACHCCGKLKISDKLLTHIQALRDIYGKPLIVNSAYRCPKHNKEVGGVPNSQHTKGTAIDITISDKKDLERLYIFCITSKLFSTVIWYKKSQFIHLDVRDRGMREPFHPVVKYWDWDK